MSNYTSVSSWTVVASAIVLIGATYLAPTHQPTTLRPFVAEQAAVRPVSPEKVRARLWQDPLEAGWKRMGTSVSGHEDGSTKVEKFWKGWQQAPKDLNSLIGNEGDQSLFILPIVLSGNPYPESGERRLRYRFALQEAMETMEFRPDNHDFLYYFPACIKPECACCADSTQKKIIVQDKQPQGLKQEDFVPVTYEIFEYIGRKENQVAKKVLVFWIDNRIIDGGLAPNYRKLETLVRYMAHGAKKISILSLSGSDELLNLIKSEDASLLPINDKTNINYVVSTAPKLQFLNKLKKKEKSETGKIDKQIAGRIARAVPSDNYVLAAIVDELQRRIPGFGIPRNPNRRKNESDDGDENIDEVWLLSEQDTFYSQVMNDEFERITSRRKLDVKVKSIGFLKGIDGNLPDDPGTTVAEHTKSLNSLADLVEFLNQSGAPEQRLFDRRQIDYLQRLAEKLLQDQRAKPFHQRVKAIGILGGDVYDKMLVLEVFRQYFPATNYFTTDLDSTYLYGPNARAARNLIIGSAFGLSPVRLADKDGNAIVNEGNVVFRDSYQTTLYHSILKVLWPDEQKGRFEQAFEDNFRIGLFEVGRSRFYPLAIGVESRSEKRYSWHYPASLDEESIAAGSGEKSTGHQEIKSWTGRKEWLLAPFTEGFFDNEKPLSILELYGRPSLLVLVVFSAAITLTIIWIFVRYSKKHGLFPEEIEPSLPHLIWHIVKTALQEKFKRSSAFSSSFFAWGLGIFVMIFFAALMIVAPGIVNERFGGLEPMYWMEGISAWPSIFLRLVIFLGGIAMLASSLAGTDIAVNRLITELEGRKIVAMHPDANPEYAQTHLKGPLTLDLFVVFVLTAMSMSIFFIIFRISDGYSDGFFTPGRGHWVFVAHEISIALSLSMLLLLVWWAAFRHHRSCTFLAGLDKELHDGRKSTEVSSSSGEKVGASLSAAEVNALEDYAGIGSVTLLPPFAMMVLLVVSRHTIFDGWNIPLVLIMFLSLMLFILLVSAFQLSSAARRLKLAEIKFNKIRAEPDKRRREVAEIASVWQNAAGPFGKYQQQPIIQALLFAAAGFGISFIEPILRLFGA